MVSNDYRCTKLPRHFSLLRHTLQTFTLWRTCTHPFGTLLSINKVRCRFLEHPSLVGGLKRVKKSVLLYSAGKRKHRTSVGLKGAGKGTKAPFPCPSKRKGAPCENSTPFYYQEGCIIRNKSTEGLLPRVRVIHLPRT